jgi:hypothetical protein
MPTPWAPDHAEHTVAVPLQRLTGRRLVAAQPSLDSTTA